MTSTNVSKDDIKKEANKIIEVCTYSYKKYFNDADTLNAKHGSVSNYSIFLSGLIGFAGVAGTGSLQESFVQTFPSMKYRMLVFGLCGIGNFVVYGLSILLKNQDYSSKAVAARNIGGEYLGLKKRIEVFKNLELPNLGINDAIKSLKAFNETIIDIDNRNPPLFDTASFTKAQEGIRRGEAAYDVEKKTE